MAKRRKRRKSSSLPTPVWVVGLVGLLLLAAGLIVFTARQGSNPNGNTLPYPQVPRISPAEAHNQQQAGGVIIDVRDAQFYQESHVAGALSLPEDELLARIDQFPTDENLILY
jgi:hypothetical protein